MFTPMSKRNFWRRFYDDAEREFDMMQQMNGPQRGRRSQHHGRNNRPITTAPGSTRPGRGNNAETEMGSGGGAIDYPPSTPTSPSTPKTNDPNAMESGFFNNKYADDQADNNGRNKTDHPTDAVNKSVFIQVNSIWITNATKIVKSLSALSTTLKGSR